MKLFYSIQNFFINLVQCWTHYNLMSVKKGFLKPEIEYTVISRIRITKEGYLQKGIKVWDGISPYEDKL